MGVYIKGMKKPKDCNACFLDLYDRQTYCRNREKALCPLIEVKAPHGRLVDESEIHTGIRMEKNTEHRYFIDRVNAPTVIEAEEGADDEF